ncbi:MAG TPA: hypothetical protein VFU94_06100 [Conexibacter sp.]|nr:hypothetical protein [Conexibacter sp.]
MNSRLLTALSVVVVVALAGVLGYAIIRGVTADPAVVGSFLTAAIAFVAVEFGRQREKRLQLLQSHRERMAPIYEDLLKMMVRGARAGSRPDERFMREFQRKLLLYGATPVIAAWLIVMRAFEARGEADAGTLLQWEGVLFAIRADLGHDNGALKPGDLLRIYVTDADEYFGSLPQ